MLKRKHTAWMKIWELALLAALCLSLCVGAWAASRQADLAGKLIRLHVVAADDSETEQAVKLEVRDAVLAVLEPQLEGLGDSASACAVVERALPQVEQAAKSAAGDRAVTVTLTEEYYPTRDYTDFSLPAGRYQSLRVILDEGAGQNWWCVVFPPLCLQASQGEGTLPASAGLGDGDIALITEADAGYEIRFHILEWWGELQEALGGGDR